MLFEDKRHPENGLMRYTYDVSTQRREICYLVICLVFALFCSAITRFFHQFFLCFVSVLEGGSVERKGEARRQFRFLNAIASTGSLFFIFTFPY